MADRSRSRATAAGRLWPWGPRAAVAATAAALVVLVAALVLLRRLLAWPDPSWDGAVLLGAVLLALIPVVLVLLDRMAGTGGTIEAFGVRIAFDAAVARARSGVEASPNMGVPPGLSIADSGAPAIIEGLERFRRNDVVVIDLEDGNAWWETRLAVACAGALRIGRPRAFVFLASVGGYDRQFQGWAGPGPLLTQLCARNPAIRHAVDTADVHARRWALAYVPQVDPPIPRPDPGFPVPTVNAHVVFAGQGRSDTAPEALLMGELAPLEREPQPIGAVRLRDLFAYQLRRAVLDRAAWGAAQLADALRCSDDYVAVVEDGRFVGLLSRATLTSEVVADLLVAADERAGEAAT